MAPFHVFPWRRRELLRRCPQQLHGTRVLRPTPGASLNRAKGIHQPQHARWAEPVRPHHGSAAQRKSISSTVSPTFFPSHNSSPATRGRNGQLGLECSCRRRFARPRPELSHSSAAERPHLIDARSPPACLQHVYTEWHQETKRHNSIAMEWISM